MFGFGLAINMLSWLTQLISQREKEMVPMVVTSAATSLPEQETGFCLMEPTAIMIISRGRTYFK
jgi:hypothetical protein